MRLLLRFVAFVALMLAGWVAPPRAQAANLDATADLVFGQPDFNTGTDNNPALGANSLSGPTGVALDVQGNLYVADTFNNRLLE